MNKQSLASFSGKKFIVVFVVILIVTSVYFLTRNKTNDNVVIKSTSAPQSIVPTFAPVEIPNVKSADKIEVVNFHRTQRCWSCSTLGKLSEKTVNEKFADEVASGRVIFKAVNVELPENKEIVNLYRASGSSLYINAIKDGENNIVQNIKVWKYLSDESAFTSYLETQLRSLL